MSTTVTIKTGDWPVEVRTFPLNDRQPVEGATWSEPQRIEPNSEEVLCVHSGQDLLIGELMSDAEKTAAIDKELFGQAEAAAATEEG